MFDNVAAWFQYSLSEKDARKLVGNVPGAVKYGLVIAWHRLPETAKELLRKAYREQEAI